MFVSSLTLRNTNSIVDPRCMHKGPTIDRMAAAKGLLSGFATTFQVRDQDIGMTPDQLHYSFCTSIGLVIMAVGSGVTRMPRVRHVFTQASNGANVAGSPSHLIPNHDGLCSPRIYPVLSPSTGKISRLWPNLE